jgi:pimeloyl-ACP methyl ester carboxylesterase
MLPALIPLKMSIAAVDGLVLSGTLTYPASRPGERAPLAVLAHQYPATRDSFAPLVADLLQLGIATLAFDQRGHGKSIWGPTGPLIIDSPKDFSEQAFFHAFVGSASRVGFAKIDDDIVRVARWGCAQNFIDDGRVVLIGASVGGSGSMFASPKLGGVLRATVTFGAAGAPAWGDDATPRIQKHVGEVRAPYLLTSSVDDPYDGAKNVREWSAGRAHVQTLLVPGREHAMAIYYQVREEVLKFVRAAV